MPRAFTEQEQAQILTALMDAGRRRFGLAGLNKTTVGELAADVGIGKGSFYLFFESKEALFFRIQEEDERAFKQRLLDELARLRDRPVARIERLLLVAAQRLQDHPILRQLTDPSVLAALQARVPLEAIAQHRRDDEVFFVDLARQLQDEGTLTPSVKPELLYDLLVAMFALSLQRELVEPDRYERVTRFLARALAENLAGVS